MKNYLKLLLYRSRNRTGGSLAQNTLLMTTSSFLTLFTGVIFTIIIGRSLTAAEFGTVGLAIAVAAIIALLPSYGFDLFVIRELVQSHTDPVFFVRNIIVLKIGLSIIALIAALMYIQLAVVSQFALTYWLFVAAEILFSFTRFNNSVSKAFENFVPEALTVLIQSISQLAFVLVLQFQMGLTSNLVGLAVLLSRTIGLAFSLHMLVGAIPLERWSLRSRAFHMRLSVSRHLLVGASPFAGQLLLSNIYYRIDTIILGQLVGAASLGYYYAARRLMDSAMRIPTVFISAFFPRISSEYANPHGKDPNRASRLLIHLMLFGGLSLATVFFVGADKIIEFLFRDNLAPAASVLRVLSIAMALRFLAGGFGAILVAHRRQAIQLTGAAMATVMTIILNITLVPRVGYIAAAWTAIIVHIIILVWYGVFIRKILGTLMLSPRQISITIEEILHQARATVNKYQERRQMS